MHVVVAVVAAVVVVVFGSVELIEPRCSSAMLERSMSYTKILNSVDDECVWQTNSLSHSLEDGAKSMRCQRQMHSLLTQEHKTFCCCEYTIVQR